MTDALNRFIRAPVDQDEMDHPRNLDAPWRQQRELLDVETFDEDCAGTRLAALSPTVRVAENSRRVLSLVALCNEAAKTSAAGIEIFKPTTRLMAVFADLPWLVPTDRQRFADIVDGLYFILYEGAGKDNLRFLDKNGGPLTEAECDLIWCVKHLRNKWLRHDADHGRDREIQKSWAELAAKYRWLGLAEHPTEERHFQTLHRILMELTEEFLALILSRLALKSE